MNKTHPLCSPLYSQRTGSAEMCLALRKSYSYLHCIAAITEKLSASISTFAHLPVYRSQSATLRSAAALYNPHSRNGTAAPRFSPTRFIPPSLLRC